MKKLFLFTALILLAVMIISACKKDNNNDNGNENTTTDEVKILSLTASKTVMNAYDTALVSVVATGSNLYYFWYSDKGTIVPNTDLAKIYFTACSNCAGYRTITCKVKNANGEASDTVHIQVNP